MHNIAFETVYFQTMIFYNMSIKTVIEKYFFETLVTKIVFKLQKSILCFTKIIYEQSRSILKWYFRPQKHLRTYNITIVHRRLCFYLQINCLSIPSVNFVPKISHYIQSFFCLFSISD